MCSRSSTGMVKNRGGGSLAALVVVVVVVVFLALRATNPLAIIGDRA